MVNGLIHPLRFARPPVSGGQFAGAVIVFRFQFLPFRFPFVTNSPPETGASTPQGGGGGCFFLFSDAARSVPTAQTD